MRSVGLTGRAIHGGHQVLPNRNQTLVRSERDALVAYAVDVSRWSMICGPAFRPEGVLTVAAEFEIDS